MCGGRGVRGRRRAAHLSVVRATGRKGLLRACRVQRCCGKCASPSVHGAPREPGRAGTPAAPVFSLTPCLGLRLPLPHPTAVRLVFVSPVAGSAGNVVLASTAQWTSWFWCGRELRVEERSVAGMGAARGNVVSVAAGMLSGGGTSHFTFPHGYRSPVALPCYRGTTKRVPRFSSQKTPSRVRLVIEWG
ncbi:hypothetical protein C8R46DRAFT_1108003 [Mycena filopes]|nr:hypothetical protein C8R46DRAFT_1108003 [Mycena filopes]